MQASRDKELFNLIDVVTKKITGNDSCDNVPHTVCVSYL